MYSINISVNVSKNNAIQKYLVQNTCIVHSDVISVVVNNIKYKLETKSNK